MSKGIYIYIHCTYIIYIHIHAVIKLDRITQVSKYIESKFTTNFVFWFVMCSYDKVHWNTRNLRFHI